MYFEKQELKSFVKYDISNVKYLDNNFEDEDDRTILVRTKGNDYMLDYKEDVIYKIKY